MPRRLTRLTEPMVRDHGALRTATWDEALDRAAEGLQRAMAATPAGGPASSAARRPRTR